ncbi:DEAD/DEAH box helicase [Neobacillus terrae]|uniref:DEAD/DEAH box helicase n=1 Tax=Neobacillus terrae TaxID=3034837 RepID=UPI00140735AF|nr:DEAD/DEAH box helicase [Neobacillus terrae]NHM31149.1 DEAD/DEAH box helicase [Neobacillus terrae]
MNTKFNQKIIIEKCGTVSFRRGEFFNRNNKIEFSEFCSNKYKAVVKGDEEIFHVIVQTDEHGSLHTKCDCTKLASYNKDCQHIAGVLLAILEHQRKGTVPIEAKENDETLTEGLINLFTNRTVQASGHLPHFEKKQVIDVAFTCKPFSLGNERYLFGLEITIGSEVVQDIRRFLNHIKEGRPYKHSGTFTYEPTLHCFEKETYDVIQQIIQVLRDQNAYGNTAPLQEHDQMLLIPSSSWERLLPMLVIASHTKLEYEGQTFSGISLTNEIFPLEFEMKETNGSGVALKINGLSKLVIFESYESVLFDGKIKKLDKDDLNRLLELIKMLGTSGSNFIPIPKEQLYFFLEKVVPGLKRLGRVNISESLTKEWVRTPLVAKLYLDRVNNKLLAGLEFQYEHISINPLERRELPGGSYIVRETAKEDQILQLIDESSFSRTEEGFYLQNEELEYEFLYHVLPKLQNLVRIYATTAVRNRISRGVFNPQIRIRVKKERTNWLEFKFEMDGIKEPQIKEVLQALEEKRKFYRLPNGSLFSLQTREFEEILRFLRSPLMEDKDLVNGLSLPFEKCLQLLDTVESNDNFKLEESFRELLDNLRNPDRLAFEVPHSFDFILKEYQKYGYKWMKTLAHFGFGGILADDMGLGKTVQSISYIVSELHNIRKDNQPVLIVCPSSLSYNWLSEFKKFSPELKVSVVDGNKTERASLLGSSTNTDVLIVSYPLLRREISWFEKQGFHTVFFDEAQAFKNPLTQTARAVKKLNSRYRFALTGTPIENSLEELWSIFHVVFPELFLGLKEYSKLSRKHIARRIQPFLLRRLKEDVLAELPDKIESRESVELFPEQKRLYAAYLAKLRHDTLKHLDKETIRKNRIRILAGLTRLRQICCHPDLFVEGYKGKSAKFEQLMEIVEESRISGRRVLIFSQFTKMLELIGRELTNKSMPFFYLDGQTPAEERVEICERFNNGERDMFLISLKAGGTGLNLMSADTVILYDTWWNPAVEEQAADRAHRMGQKNVVQVIKLVARGTIEEKMNDLQDKKRDLIGEIIDSDEKIISSLTEEDIRELLMI